MQNIIKNYKITNLKMFFHKYQNKRKYRSLNRVQILLLFFQFIQTLLCVLPCYGHCHVKSAIKCIPGWGLQNVWRWFMLRFRMVLSHTQTTPKRKPSTSRFESITNQSKIQVNVGYSYPIIEENSENSQDVFVIVSQLVNHCFYLFIGGCEGEYSVLMTSWCGFFG